MEGEAQVRLVFAGEVLDGFQLHEVKRRFGEAFKIEGVQLAAMFSGERTVLKRALPAAEGARYVAKLATLGARIHIEPLQEPKPAPAAPAALAIPAAIPALAPLEEQITCPNCGERQRKQVFCRACTTDMPRGIAAKKEDAEQARAERLDAARAGGRYAPPRAAGAGSSGDMVDPPPMLSLSFEGRMGRVSYFNAGGLVLLGFLLVGVFAWVVTSLFGREFGFVSIPVALMAIMVCVWAVRVSVLRLHDFNRSGWWVLLTCIPVLAWIVSLVLLFVPGSAEDNDYGERPRQGNGVVAVVLAILYLMATLYLMSSAMTLYRMYAKQGASQVMQEPTGADPATQQRAAQYLSSPAALDAYAAYASESNQKAFATGGGGAFGWHAGQASRREAMSRAMSACDANRKPYTSECHLVNINGAWPKEE